jgi:CheY-like chemotaxis protein
MREGARIVQSSAGLTALLVVDDEQGMRDTLADILEERHFSVAQAANGEEALSMVGQHRFDLVLMDVRMPVMDGVTALEHIAAQEPHPPVILMTAYAQSSELNRAAGQAAAIVHKPLDLPALLALIRQVVEQSAPDSVA